MDSATHSQVEPAWAYRRNWNRATTTIWKHTPHGDGLLLSLPAGLIALQTHNEEAVESLAWQESRFGTLPRTWVSRPEKAAPGVGYRLYMIPAGATLQDVITTGATFDTILPVWPTPTENEGRFTWYDGDGVSLLGPPPARDVTDLPWEWLDAHQRWRDERDVKEPATVSDWLDKFVRDTLVYSGEEHDRATTEDMYATYKRWCELIELHPVHRANKIHFGRWLSETAGYRRWAGRSNGGFRRGYLGLRLPDGAWLQ